MKTEFIDAHKSNRRLISKKLSRKIRLPMRPLGALLLRSSIKIGRSEGCLKAQPQESDFISLPFKVKPPDWSKKQFFTIHFFRSPESLKKAGSNKKLKNNSSSRPNYQRWKSCKPAPEDNFKLK
jgi:hypothetical protein